MNPGIATANAPNTIGRSYTITAEIDVPQDGSNGMLATLGGRWGGWGLYLLNGKPVFNYNMLILAQYQWVAKNVDSRQTAIVFDYTYDGPGIAKGGSGVLKVDGKIAATGKQANSIAFLQVADETFDIGVDTRTGVNDKDYQVPFAFNGKIDKLTVKLGPSQLAAADQKAAQEGIGPSQVRSVLPPGSRDLPSAAAPTA